MQAALDDAGIADDERHDIPQLSDLDDTVDENLRNTAQLFLQVHRTEIAARDAEISRLKMELTRVREGLKGLKEQTQKSTGVGNPSQQSTGESADLPEDYVYVQAADATVAEPGWQTESLVTVRLDNILTKLDNDGVSHALVLASLLGLLGCCELLTCLWMRTGSRRSKIYGTLACKLSKA